MDLHIKVKPRSRINSIKVENDGTVVVKINALPVDGKANEEVIKVLSKQFKLPQSAFEIIRGHTNPYKTIRVDGKEDHILDILEELREK